MEKLDLIFWNYYVNANVKVTKQDAESFAKEFDGEDWSKLETDGFFLKDIEAMFSYFNLNVKRKTNEKI